MILFPILSLTVISLIIYLLSTGKFFTRTLCILIFSFLSISWILNMGFCGSDMDYYLDLFQKYTFQNFISFDSFEFSVGFITSLLKLIIPFSSPEGIANSYRILIFSIIPCLYIIKSNSSRHATYLLISFSTFTFLLPYSFLSASNMIKNGLSITLISYFLITFLLNNYFTLKRKQKSISFDQFFLLFFAFFAHLYGMFTILIGLSCIFGFYSLKFSKLLSIGKRFPNLLNISIFTLPLITSGAIFGISFLNYTLKDSTVLISSTILFLCLFISGFNLNLIFKISKNDNNYFSRNFLKVTSLIWLTIICISTFSIIIGLLGAGAAAERFISSFIGYNLLFSINLFLISSLFINKKKSLNMAHFSNKEAYLTKSIVLSLGLIAALNFYFYNSNAFIENVVGSC